MGKQMIAAAPGVLKRLMATRNVTQSELANQVGIDVKTLRAILNGEAVKDVTLKKLALKFALPVEHLLADTEATVHVQDSNLQEGETRDSVLLKRVTAASLKDTLRVMEAKLHGR